MRTWFPSSWCPHLSMPHTWLLWGWRTLPPRLRLWLQQPICQWQKPLRRQERRRHWQQCQPQMIRLQLQQPKQLRRQLSQQPQRQLSQRPWPRQSEQPCSSQCCQTLRWCNHPGRPPSRQPWPSANAAALWSGNSACSPGRLRRRSRPRQTLVTLQTPRLGPLDATGWLRSRLAPQMEQCRQQDSSSSSSNSSHCRRSSSKVQVLQRWHLNCNVTISSRQLQGNMQTRGSQPPAGVPRRPATSGWTCLPRLRCHSHHRLSSSRHSPHTPLPSHQLARPQRCCRCSPRLRRQTPEPLQLFMDSRRLCLLQQAALLRPVPRLLVQQRVEQGPALHQQTLQLKETGQNAACSRM